MQRMSTKCEDKRTAQYDARNMFEVQVEEGVDVYRGKKIRHSWL